MLKRMEFRLVVAAVLGFSGVSRGLEYDPFPTCSEAWKADSMLVTLQKVDSESAASGARITTQELTRFQYVPGTCIPRLILKGDPGSDLGIRKTEFHERIPLRVYDVLESTVPNKDLQPGAAFYSEQGKLDSSMWIIPHVFPPVENDSGFMITRYVDGPGYSLIESLSRHGSGPSFRSAVDSIVDDDSGRTVRSFHQAEGSWTTRCRTEGPTYVCELKWDRDLMYAEKRTWFLTQGRPDSLQLRIGGVLYYSTRYYWASGSTGIKAAPTRGKSVPSHGLWEGFDILGRIKAWRHTRF
jgi:hypothetical protein